MAKAIYNRRGQKTFGFRLDDTVLEQFTEASKQAGISKQLIMESLIKGFIAEQLGQKQ